MGERIVVRGFVSAVRFWSHNPPDVIIAERGGYDVPEAEADKALAAKRADKEIEIVQPEGGCWKNRTVRLVPVVVVKARGLVDFFHDTGHVTGRVGLRDRIGAWEVLRAELQIAARAYADDAEVEIVSIDGGPDMVRRVS